VSGLQECPGIEGLEVLCLQRPLEHGEGEQAGREPGSRGKGCARRAVSGMVHRWFTDVCQQLDTNDSDL
jgi:hypothetical protein